MGQNTPLDYVKGLFCRGAGGMLGDGFDWFRQGTLIEGEGSVQLTSSLG